jgi:uncharacterized protein
VKNKPLLNAPETKLFTDLRDHANSSTYVAPRWLIGAHTQTIWPALVAPKQAVIYRRERWDTGDGDFIDVDITDPKDPNSAPTLVLFHGLEGNSDSSYARAIMARAKHLGWRGLVAHFRGCSGEVNRLPRAYHSGDSEHIDFVLRHTQRAYPASLIFASGVSLGGNALLKWLGTTADSAQIARAAYAISPPHDLEAGAQVLSQGFNRRYTNNFLTTLKKKTALKAEKFPDVIDLKRALSADDFFAFDDAVTAPLHGFSSCYDYWRKSSCKQFLGEISVPTEILNALNDPFQPTYALATPKQISSQVNLRYPAQGGHVGFLMGWPLGHQDWLCDQLFQFFQAYT